jgi:hypothetical protein
VWRHLLDEYSNCKEDLWRLTGLKQLESCRDSFRQLTILAEYCYTFKKQSCMQKIIVTLLWVNKCIYATQETVKTITAWNSIQPSAAGCIFYSKSPNNIKHAGNNNQFKEEFKDLLIKGRYYLSLTQWRILQYWLLMSDIKDKLYF